MIHKKLLTLFYFLFISVSIIYAQQPILKNFAPAVYGSGTQNWCVSQDACGRMFFANNDGLLCYDGDRWSLHAIPNYTAVRAVMCDTLNGLIYAGATNEFGYYRYDPSRMSLVYTSLSAALPSADHGFGEIWAIHQWGETVVFQGKNNIFLCRKGRKPVNIHPEHRVDCSTVVGGRLVFASRAGLFEVTAGNAVRELPGTAAMRGLTVRAVMEHEGSMLFATADNGIFRYDGITGCAPWPSDIDPMLREGQIFCAAVSGDYMVLGTVRRGLILKNLRNGSVQYANTATGLRNNTVLSVMSDRQGNIWLGLDNGIAYVQPDTPYYDLLGELSSIGTGYTSAVSDGRLYLGTNQGLFFIPLPLKSEPVPPRPVPVRGMTGQIWSLRSVGGRLLCGSDNGAYVIDGTAGSRIAGTEGTWNFCRLKHHPGYVLVADYKGFLMLKDDGRTLSVHGRLARIASISSGAMEEDDDGTVWIAHWQKGIYHIRLNSGLTDATVIGHYAAGKGLLVNENNILCRVGGRILISSVDGFYAYDRRRNRLVYDKATSSIFNTYGTALSLYETPEHNLVAVKARFVATARRKIGGYVVDSVSLRSIADRLQTGLGNIGQLDLHHCILNHDNGFFIIGDRVNEAVADNRLLIRCIRSTGDADSVVYAAGPMPDSVGIELPHSMNSIKIEFVQPEYPVNADMEYTCRLEGYDKAWSQPQRASYKEYTKLPQGRYTFRVRARNRISGRTQEAQIGITVEPAWYETWVAWLIYIIMVMVAVRYILIAMKRRSERELVRIKAEKERQLREQEIKLQVEREKRKHQLAEMRNEQLDTELKHKQSQLSDSTMNLMRKNDMLQQIDEDMADLSEAVRRGDVKTKLTRQIQDIRKNIQTNMKDDENWEKFEENFNLVYDDFMKKLSARFPDLKTNDRKLCAYLRMGMSSKEMASLLNTPVRSIETARYRLRKKLDLDSGDNLTEFIQSIGEQAS